LKHSTTYGTDQGQGGIYYNLFDSHAPFQIDGNFGVCSGIAEMLLQSAHGYINILPALPKVWEKNGDVTGMKAIGNFTVNFNWVDGKCQKATIVSNAGAELKVRCDRGAMALDKAKVTVNGTEVAVELGDHAIATIPCVKGDVVEIDFTTETAIAPVVAGTAKNGAIYDLSGRRVNGADNGHVYIQDGVKKLAK
jgi:alpha-L-fucosidase 2